MAYKLLQSMSKVLQIEGLADESVHATIKALFPV
jgi:hypothetical protein